MITKIYKLTLLLALFIGFNSSSNAQGYIEASTYLGGTSVEAEPIMVVSSGESYILGRSSSANFTTTLGSSFGGGIYDATLTKLDANGNVLWSRFIGGNGTNFPTSIMVSNGLVFIAINTTSTNFPVTDGSTKTGAPADNNSVFAVLEASTGVIQFSSYLGKGYPQDIAIEDNSVYVSGTKDLGGTLGYQLQLVKYDMASNSIVYNNDFGGTGIDGTGEQIRNNKTLQVADGKVYFVAHSYSSNFPVTNGSSLSGTFDHVYLKINGTTGNIEFATYFGGSTSTINYGALDLRIDNSGVYILGLTSDVDFPVTDGSTNKGSDDYYLRKYNLSTNALVYSKLIGSVRPEQLATMEVENGTIYLAGELQASNDYPHTNLPGSYNGPFHLFYTKLNANSGNITYSTWIHSNRNEYFGDLYVQDGDVYLIGVLSGSAATITYPITNGTTKQGASDELIITKINANNQICYSTFLGGPSDEYSNSFQVVNNNIYIVGETSGNAYPVTNTITKKTGNEFIWTKLNLNPNLTVASDSVMPATQTVCRNGVASMLTAPEIIFPSDSMPKIYRNGVLSNQNVILLKYQWQKSTTSTGPWSNIPGAIQLNYSPEVGLVDVYYRRITSSSVCGSTTPTSISSVASVLVNANTAPTINLNGVVNTCAGSTVVLGGSPTATPNGGASIVSYLWTPTGTYTPSNAVANPSVTPTGNAIYIVTVTDNNGCQQIGQQLVNAYAANAGADKSSCNNAIVRIGADPIAGLSGVSYTWSSVSGDPVSKLSCTSCAQPDVSNLTQVSTYQLSLTIPITGGGTCTTTDNVIVTPVAAPTANFAGSDVTICLGSTTTIGTASQAGFTYTWAPGNYLVTNNTAQVTFQPGSLKMPTPNPITYYVTALNQGCIFVDEMVATVIEAKAGTDGCGPRSIGEGDRTPTINETYSWTKLSGNGSIIGASNTPTINVSATTSGVTIYELTVTHNGTTCTDQVQVPTCGCIPPTIKVEAPNTCPDFNINGGNVKLIASTPINSTFSWSPSTGLSASTGSEVFLTDDVQRTYTVTATSIIDPTYFCTQTISVNNPAWSLPVFSAKDTSVCPNVAVSIGQASVSGYTYEWTDPTSKLSATTSSNPTATVKSTNSFPVLVTDVGSGCTVRDTATIAVDGFPANIAGTDITLCGASPAVQLGVNPVPGLTYAWTPAASYTPNNTTANPTVPVATSSSFYILNVNNATGCSMTDTITVIIQTPVTPFTLSNQTFCPSTSGAMALPAGPSGMTTYAWSPASLVLNNTSNGPTATSLATRPQTETTYTLTVSNSVGCTAAADVKFIPSVVIPHAGISRSICLGETAQVGGVNLGGTYAWTQLPVAGGSLSSTSISNPVFTPTVAGTYTLTVSRTDPGGCITTNTVVITVNSITLGALSSPTVCQNTCVQIGYSSPISGAQYFWSPTTGLNDATIPNPIACMTTATTSYKLTVVGANGCVATRDVIVGVNPTPSPTVTIPNVTACLGATGVKFNPIVTPSSVYNYIWSPNDGTLSSIYDSTPNVNITAVGNKNYNLRVTDSATGCANSATVTLTTEICPALNAIGNFVWLDTDKDGVQDAGEPGVAQVGVNLFDNGTDGLPNTADDILIGATNTDAYGKYLFTGLPDGNYNVQFILPVDYVFTQTAGSFDTDSANSDANLLTGRTGTIRLEGGERELDVDAGIYLSEQPILSSIGDYVWFDTNSDGVQDGSESGISGITVTLYDDATGNVIAITKTDGYGKYIFNDLPVGTYKIGFTPTQGTKLTTSSGTTAGNATLNSDANQTTGLTTTITISTPGTKITGIDAGIVPDTKASLGDFVWIDSDQDGIQDAGEPGVSGVTMTLYDAGPDGLVGGGDDILVATTTTDANGYYHFGNLDPKNYFVTASIPAGYTRTTANAGADDYMDSDFDLDANYPTVSTSSIYPLQASQHYGGVDLGIYNSTPNLSSLGDKVWFDKNSDGIQDAGENGVGNVTVSLLDASGNPVNNPTTGKPYVVTTDDNGNYLFVDLSAGNYKVKFSNIPENTQFTKTGAGTTSTDSDPNPTTGITNTIALGSNQHIRTVDAGINTIDASGKASLGNYVWVDADNDGLQDAGEQGVKGVTVKLYKDLNNDGIINGNELTTPFATTVTNSLGAYIFNNLDKGTYQVEFVKSTLPAGYDLQSGKNNIGANDALDSDADPVTGKTALISLNTGEDNMTIDAGIYNSTATNSIGDKVWLDQDADGVQDVGEPGVPGVSVNLLDATGNIIATVITDENGNYHFGNLPNGTYSVQVEKPVGFNFTISNAPSATAATNSDVNPATGKTQLVTLTGNTNITDLDAGLTTTKAALGNKVWYDINKDGIQDASEAGVAGITVLLYFDADGNGSISGAEATNPVASAITDANGNYLFANLDPGKYIVGFNNIPPSLKFTQQNTAGDNQNNTNSDANPTTGLSSIIDLSAGELDLTIDAGLTPDLKGSVGDIVWFDEDLNGDRTAGEALVPGVLVTLYDAANNVLGVAVTNGNGKFRFNNLEEALGHYIIFSNIPAGSSFTSQTIGNLTGSDANPSTGVTGTFGIIGGQHTPNIDAGITVYVPLPIQVLNFNAVKVESSSKLTWKVTDLKPNTKMIVEWSKDGKVWSKIGDLISMNTSDYIFYHKNPTKGINFYKIKFIEENGNIYYTHVKNVIFDVQIVIGAYPNPTAEIISVSILENTDLNFDVIVYNSVGQKMYTNIIVNNLNINVKDWASGVYTIYVNSAEIKQTFKFIISK